jgi:hypothetical protein
MNRPLALLTILIFFCTGCDGVYIYTYRGTLSLADKTPARDLPVRVTAYANDTNPTLDSQTDTQGRFTGSFVTSTGWIILGPPAPKIKIAYLPTPATPPITIPLNNIEQPTTTSGRDLTLPPIILPAR